MMDVKLLQKTLRGLGLYWGRIDSIIGPKTKEAIKKFQRLHPPLMVDGIPGRRTQAAMFLQSYSSRDADEPAHKRGKWPRQRDVREFYGPVGRNQTKILLPYAMKIAWDLDKSVSRITCHEKVADNMQGIFEEVLDEYGLGGVRDLRLDLYGGCLNVRKMRGGSRYSMHSWGIAVDIDPAHNQFRWTKSRAQLSRAEYEPFWKIVEKHGAISLGRERDFDWMHFQFARL
jgi:hypothetical protein